MTNYIKGKLMIIFSSKINQFIEIRLMFRLEYEASTLGLFTFAIIHLEYVIVITY